MPIYAYKCSSCGHAKDALQKVSDAPLTVCPACGEPHFQKQLTAAGFQLKGSGWYVTDFRNGQAATSAPADSKGSGEVAAKSGDAPTPAASSPAPAPAAGSASAPASAPAAASPSAGKAD
jgi:putative FmdB family regulatory protein